jgi:hypothetical protein
MREAKRVHAGAREHAQEREPQLRVPRAEASAVWPAHVEAQAPRVRRHTHHVQRVEAGVLERAELAHQLARAHASDRLAPLATARAPHLRRALHQQGDACRLRARGAALGHHVRVYPLDARVTPWDVSKGGGI